MNGNGHNGLRFTFDSPNHSPEPSCAEPLTTGLVGEDPTYRQATELARTIAPTTAPVLIVGERGVGKTSLARVIHEKGPRPSGPFIEASCANLKESVLDVELFGRRNGGYAEPDRVGKVELARGGTLFIDDVSALTPELQLKLLQLLRDGMNQPVGATAPERADVRVLMGTREELANLVPDGRFRQDLYYRIGVVTLKLPPLRHRSGDLERLTEHFRVRFARQLGKDVRSISPEAMALLRSHGWPGNVHELAETIERAVVVCRGQRIEPNHLALTVRDASSMLAVIAGSSGASIRPQRHAPHANNHILPLKEALEGPERQLILEALEALNWNRQETARVLDINRTTLYKKMKKYGLLFDEPAWAN
jgi:two-component system response regulator HydG